MIALLVALLLGAAPKPPHQILVLDDSGSMELQYDVHGYGLAAPELFHRLLGQDLSVFLLAQSGPRGDVPRLGPGDFVSYPRENGTFYRKAIDQAIREADAVQAKDAARRVDILLVTDAEPSDADARAAIDRALAAHPSLSFRCVLLGTRDEGDLCEGRATAAADGFEMAQLLARHLGKALGSLPQWGRLGPQAKSTTITFGKFVKRAHLILLGARAGEDFSAEVVDGTPRALETSHTRPLVPSDELRIHALAQGLGAAPVLPVGPSPSLAFATHTVEAHGADDITLRLTRSDGEVAWAVMLEYDLVAATVAPAEASDVIAVRTHLTHAGAHVDDVAALRALGLTPTLHVVPRCAAACPPARDVPLTFDDAGWATTSVSVEDDVDQYSFEARFTSPTADLRAPPASTRVTRAAVTQATPLPTTTPPPPATADPTPTPVPATPVPTPTPAPAPATRITRWVPPFLSLPEWQVEGDTLGYALTVTQADGKPLSGADIQAQKLSAALVVDGRELPMTLNGDRFEATFPTGSPGRREARLRLLTPDGPLDSNLASMEVLPDARVRVAPTTDAGLVEAGCDATERCVGFQLLGSQQTALTGLTVTRTAEGTWDDVRLTLRRGDATWILERGAPVSVPAGATDVPLEICVAPPGCSDTAADAFEAIDVAPGDARLATSDRVARTRITATVTPSTWLDCNLWWVVLVVTGLLLVFLVYGWVRPLAFPLGAVVHVASGSDGERRLARDPGRPLRAVPHGRRGFYRSATCAFDASGYTVKKSKSHVLMLRADRSSQIALVPRGATVERRQRGGWIAVDRQNERHLLSGVIYRINGSFFVKILA